MTDLKKLHDDATPLPHELIRYEHGGGRLALISPERYRTLIADFYNEGDRELFHAIRNATPDILQILYSLRDCCERMERARKLLQEMHGGNWGMLDTDAVRRALEPFKETK